jgi:MOSC domain-containing protein YiiM
MAVVAGIAFKRRPGGAVESAAASHVSVEAGMADDYRGAHSRRRQLTVLRAEDWAEACAAVGAAHDWTCRRANLLVEGLPCLANSAGEQLRIGSIVLEITGETDPCSRMDEVQMGLQAALQPHWRGGVTCRVLFAGPIALGDAVTLTQWKKGG